MKYLFIILIAFSFIGCDDEDVSSNHTVYATFTLLSNNDGIFNYVVGCGNTLQSESTNNATALPVGTTLTTDSYLTNGNNNVLCNVTCSGLTGSMANSGENSETEIKLYVDGELFETRVVTGSNNFNFIIP